MDKEALQILNMFMTATQVAKSQDNVKSEYNVQRTTLIELFKKAFPYLKNNKNLLNFVDDALN